MVSWIFYLVNSKFKLIKKIHGKFQIFSVQKYTARTWTFDRKTAWLKQQFGLLVLFIFITRPIRLRMLIAGSRSGIFSGELLFCLPKIYLFICTGMICISQKQLSRVTSHDLQWDNKQTSWIQLFRQRLSNKSVKEYATMPIGIMGRKSLALIYCSSRCLATRKEKA